MELPEQWRPELLTEADLPVNSEQSNVWVYGSELAHTLREWARIGASIDIDTLRVASATDPETTVLLGGGPHTYSGNSYGAQCIPLAVLQLLDEEMEARGVEWIVSLCPIEHYEAAAGFSLDPGYTEEGRKARYRMPFISEE